MYHTLTAPEPMDDIEQEAEWIRQCRKGDKQAFGPLVKKYMKQAYYSALTMVGSHEDALDLSQEAFARAFRASDAFDTQKRFYTWYYHILRNLCINHLRDRERRALPFSGIADTDMNQDHPTNDMNPSQLLEQREQRKLVWDALWRLRIEDRELIVAREMLDTPYKVLAELMDVPIGTVMSRLYTARRRLREALEGAG